MKFCGIFHFQKGEKVDLGSLSLWFIEYKQFVKRDEIDVGLNTFAYCRFLESILILSMMKFMADI